MKLTYRDKIIAGILLAIVVLLIFFFGLIKPKSQDIKDNQATLEAKQAEKDDLEARIAKIEPLKTNILDTYDEISKLTADFVPMEEIATPQMVDEMMQKYADESGVRIIELNVTNLAQKEMGYYYMEYEDLLSELRDQADINGEYAEKVANLKAESDSLSSRNNEMIMGTDYAIKIVGTKENIWAYLKNIEEIGTTILVDQVSITDYTFGAGENGEESSPSTAETPDAETPDAETPTAENSEAGAETSAETEPETPAPAGAPVSDEIKEGKNVSEAQIVISLYSVYNMAKPNVD